MKIACRVQGRQEGDPTHCVFILRFNVADQLIDLCNRTILAEGPFPIRKAEADVDRLAWFGDMPGLHFPATGPGSLGWVRVPGNPRLTYGEQPLFVRLVAEFSGFRIAAGSGPQFHLSTPVVHWSAIEAYCEPNEKRRKELLDAYFPATKADHAILA